MARRRIFAKSRSSRWPAVAGSALAGVAAAGFALAYLLHAISGEARLLSCTAAEVRRELPGLLRDHPSTQPTAEVEIGALREWRRLFESERLVARDCAATAWIDGEEERVRFRIRRDGGEVVVTLRGV